MSSEFVKTKAKAAGTLFKNNAVRVLGHDGAYSIPLRGGKVFWDFGDTLLGPERQGYDPTKIDITEWCIRDPWAKRNIRMISNTGLVSEARGVQQLVEGNFQYYVHERAGETGKTVEAREIIPVPQKLRGRIEERMAFWPFDGIDIEGKLYIFYFMVKCVNTTMDVAGAGLAKSTFPYTEFQRLSSTEPAESKKVEDFERPYVWWDNSTGSRNSQQVPGFGTAVVKKVIDGYVYVYGSRSKARGRGVVPGVSLAKIKKNAIEDIAQYEYLTVPPTERNNFTAEWSDSPRESAVVFEGNANELSVSYNPFLKKYLTVYSSARSLIKKLKYDEIQMRVADKPEGPWSPPWVIYRPERSWKKDFCYAAKEHPEYSPDGRTTYVTYVSHQRYFPEFLEVQIERSE